MCTECLPSSQSLSGCQNAYTNVYQPHICFPDIKAVSQIALPGSIRVYRKPHSHPHTAFTHSFSGCQNEWLPPWHSLSASWNACTERLPTRTYRFRVSNACSERLRMSIRVYRMSPSLSGCHKASIVRLPNSYPFRISKRVLRTPQIAFLKVNTSTYSFSGCLNECLPPWHSFSGRWNACTERLPSSQSLSGCQNASSHNLADIKTRFPEGPPVLK